MPSTTVCPQLTREDFAQDYTAFKKLLSTAKKDDDGALTRDETSHLLDVLKLDADNDLLKDEKGPHLEFSVEHQKMVELQEKMVQMEESQREILRVLGKAFPASSASAPDLTL